MPKKTFFNLNEDKMQIILNSAINEFSRVPFDEASINNIVSNANIPRGSFYQYFENKEDLYEYIIQKIFKNKGTSLSYQLKENNGDLFKSFEEIFLQEFEFFKDDTYHNLFKNFFAHSRQSMKEKFNNKIFLNSMNKHHEEILKLIDINLYNVDKKNIPILFHLLFSSMHNLFIKADIENLSKEETLNLYKDILNIFKYGVLKTND